MGKINSRYILIGIVIYFGVELILDLFHITDWRIKYGLVGLLIFLYHYYKMAKEIKGD